MNLPPNWSWVKLGDVAKLVRGVSYKKELATKSPRENYLPIVRATNINSSLNFNDLVYVPKKLIKDEQIIKEGDVIIAMSSGSKDLVGKTAQAYADTEAGFGTFCGLIRFSSTVNKRFFGYFFQSREYRNHISKVSMGVNINNLRREHIEELTIPLPPLPEQKKIVEKIEELFSGLDSGVASLKKAKEQIRLYRQSVLSAAFSGKLVKDEKRETKEELVAHLNGVQGASNKKVEHLNGIQEVTEQEMLEHLPYKQVVPKAAEPKVGYDKDLPEGWKWVKLGEVSEIINGYAFKSGSFKEEGKYQVIKIGNLRPGIIRLNEKPAFIDELEDQIVNRSLLKKGDLIISLTGTRKKRDYGYVAMVTNQKNLLLNQRLAIIRLKKEYNSTYFLYLLRMDFFLDQFFLNETGNVGQGNVGINGIRESILPVPTLIEQTQIVEEIEKRFSEADNLEKAIDDSLKKSEALRQSILKQAFEGRLI